MQDGLAPDALPRRQRPMLLKLLADYGVQGAVNMRATRFTGDGLYAAGPDGEEKFFPADTLICAAGRRAREAVADSFRDSAPMVRYIGDCVVAGRLVEAMSLAYTFALDI